MSIHLDSYRTTQFRVLNYHAEKSELSEIMFVKKKRLDFFLLNFE